MNPQCLVTSKSLMAVSNMKGITSKPTMIEEKNEQRRFSSDNISFNGSYLDYLNAFTCLPSDVVDRAAYSSEFYAFPLLVKSSIKMSILPITTGAKETLQTLVSFEEMALPSLQKSTPPEVTLDNVYGAFYNGHFCRVRKISKNAELYCHYDGAVKLDSLCAADIFALPTSISSLPCLRYRAAMLGLFQSSNEKGTEFTQNLVCGKILFLKSAEWITNNNGVPIVLGKFYSFDGLTNYADLVEKEGYATTLKSVRTDNVTKSSGPSQSDLQHLADSWGLSKFIGQKNQLAKKVPLLQNVVSYSKVYSTVIESPNIIWAQVFHDDASDFQKLMEEMNEAYIRTTNASYVPCVGDVSAAKFSDGLFYRAEVLAVNASGSVTVRFLDYGNMASVSFKDLRHIRTSFMSFPRQAIQFSLADISPFDSVSWSLEACQFVREIMLEKPIEINVVSAQNSKYLIEAYDASHNSIADLLVKRKLACKSIDVSTSSRITIGRGSIFNYNTGQGAGVGSCSNASNGYKSRGPGGLSQSNFSRNGNHWKRSKSTEGTEIPVQPVQKTTPNKKEVSNFNSTKLSMKSMQSCHPAKNSEHNTPSETIMSKANLITEESPFHDILPETDIVPMCLASNVTDVCSSSSSDADEPSFISMKLNNACCPRSQPTYDSLEKVSVSCNFTPVVLVHVCSPSELYVHIAEEPYITFLSSVANDPFNDLKPHQKPLVVGDVCATKFSEDQMWYRAVISEVRSGGEYCVHFFDFGNYETVLAQSVMVCPEHLLSIPVLAVKCSIGGVVPATGNSWNPLCASYIANTYLSKVLLCRLLESGLLDVELCDTSSSENIADVLIQQSFAISSRSLNSPTTDVTALSTKQLVKPSISPANSCGANANTFPDTHVSIVSDVSSLSLDGQSSSSVCAVVQTLTDETSSESSNQVISAATSHIFMAECVKKISLHPYVEQLDAVIVHAENLSEIYILLNRNMQSFMEFSSVIESYYEVAPELLTLPLVGQLCLANSLVNGIFRAEVISVNRETLDCVVQSIDYGSCEVLPWSALRQVNDSIFAIERQALMCGLTGVMKDVDMGKAKVLLEETFMQVQLTCYISSHVPLLVDFSCGGIMLRDELVKLSILPPIQNKLAISPCKVVLNDTVLVISTYNPSPKHFWVQIANEESAANCEVLCTQLQELCPKSLPIASPVLLGDFVTAIFEEDNQWYRAKVIDVSGIDPVLQFVDFGNTQKTPITNIHYLPNSLALYPTQAILCCLESHISASKCELFKELIADKFLTCKFKDCIDAGTIVVDLTLYDSGDNISALLKD